VCRSPKSCAGCHFGAAIGLRSLLEGFAPTIPDFALDMHTLAGRKQRQQRGPNSTPAQSLLYPWRAKRPAPAGQTE
jgi:hypothetical protein